MQVSSRFLRHLLWILALAYFAGVILWSLGPLLPGLLLAAMSGLGLLVIGMVMLVFTGSFLRLLRHRTHIPPQGASHTPHTELLVERVRQRRREEQCRYGPYVALIGSAYLWGSLGALLMGIDGIASLLFGALPVMVDAIRHSFAVGFITLLDLRNCCTSGTQLLR